MRWTSLVMIGGLALSLGCGGGEPATQEYPDAVAADPQHYSVEFENDAVRLLRIRYGPGEQSVMHTHPPICSIALTDASWRMTAPSGEVNEEEPSTLGDVGCEPEVSVHNPENSGDAVNELILVELKQDASAGMAAASLEYPDAVTGDPGHYTVEFENDVVRLLRASYGAGEQSVMHYHPAHCYVSLTDGTWHMTDPAGEVTELATPLGSTGCIGAGPHQPANATGETGAAILIEFKGRATAQ